MEDTFVTAESITASVGNITATNGNISATNGTITVATGSITGTGTIATLNSTTQYGGTSGASGVALTSAGTIAVARVSKVNPGSAVTAVIMANGTLDGQELTIMNTAPAAGSSVTFATAGTAAASSHLATDFVISGLTCAKFVWDTTTALWYPVVN